MIPWDLRVSWSKGGDPFGGLSAWERSKSYQLVGEVTAHQGNDGYRD